MTSDSEIRPADARDVGHPAEGGSATEQTGERRERRSRDRYGRDRRERNGESRQDSASEEAAHHEAAASVDALAPAQSPERPAARSYFDRAQPSSVATETESASKPATEPASAEVLDTVPAQVAVESALSAPVEAPATALPLTAQVPAEQPPEPPSAAPVLPTAVSFSLPIDQLQQLAQSSGLVWVNSDTAKVAAVQAAIAAEPPAIHVPRERPPAVVVNDGPLVLVETRKDLNTLKVPF